VVDYVGSIAVEQDGSEGEPEWELFEGGEGRDQLVELGGGNLIPGFEESLIGAGAGETRTVPLTFPAEYGNTELAGRDASFEITVKEVKLKELPALDDDFATDAGFDDMEELRADIRARLLEVEEGRVEADFRQAALDAAVSSARVATTPELVKARAREMWERMLHSLSHRGISREAYLQITGREESEILTEMEPEAELALRREAVITAIVEAEGISPSEEQLLEALAPTALEDASLSTWIHPRDGTEYIYYSKGSLAGLLLDIMIRDASDNHSSLDDVLRTLYNTAYKNGRGFTSDEWWSTVSKAAKGRSFSDFYARYIDGREPLPYDKVLPLAGLRLARDTAHVPQLGIASLQDSTGLHVTQVISESAAAVAGVQPGDQLISVGGFNADDPNWTEKFRYRYARQPEGTELPVVIRRNGAEQTLTARLHFVISVGSHLIEDARASAKARKVRDGLLRGVTQP